MPSMAGTPHPWKFHRAGGVDQVTLRDGADVAAIRELDPKLWVAIALPTRGVALDAKTLDLIDTDKDGRIRPPEVVAAVDWITQVLKNPTELLKGGDELELAASPALAGSSRTWASRERPRSRSPTSPTPTRSSPPRS